MTEEHPLARLRAERKLSQTALSELAQVSRPTIGQLEHGLQLTRETRAVQKIAAALGVEVDDIVAPGQLGVPTTYEVVAKFFDLDPGSPQTRPYLETLKAEVWNAA